MKSIRKKYRSYGNYYQSTAEVFYPTSIEELQEIIQFAKDNNRKMTLAGSFHSLDNQNSGSDMVISLMKINFISFNKEDHTIEVGPGANWGNILKIAYANNCVPYIVITGSKPTAGGTLSANTNSQFSPSCGKEGKYCIEFDLLTPKGELLNCSRTKNAEIFYGVIGGMGILGFITRIKYQLFNVGSPYKIDYNIKLYNDVDDIEARFDVRESKEYNSVDDLKSQGSLFYFDGEKPKICILNRQYVPIEKKQKHNKWYFYYASLSFFLVRFFPKIVNRHMVKDESTPVKKKSMLKKMDNVYFGTFYADSDYIWQKYFGKILSFFGYKPKIYENTYFIPLVGNNVTIFNKKICELLLKYKLQFGMYDIMYIPKDEPFVLSASKNIDGFNIAIAFFDRVPVEPLMAFYKELNKLCFEMNGRLTLVKNLFIETDMLEKMYEDEIKELVELKRITDPDNLIVSNFFKEKFPNYFNREMNVNQSLYAINVTI